MPRAIPVVQLVDQGISIRLGVGHHLPVLVEFGAALLLALGRRTSRRVQGRLFRAGVPDEIDRLVEVRAEKLKVLRSLCNVKLAAGFRTWIETQEDAA